MAVKDDIVNGRGDHPCCVLYAKHDVRMEDSLPTEVMRDLGPDEILVEPKFTGICGSDLHWYRHGQINDMKMLAPKILGHEAAGVVHEVGSKVQGIKPGDHVALEVALTCRKCEYCKAGIYEHCPNGVFPGQPHYPGTLRHMMQHPVDFCHLMPSDVSLEEGAMVEPLAVAVQAVLRVGNLQLGENVLVFGAGPIGLLVMAVARAMGARRILAFDISQDRLDFAKQMYQAETCLTPSRDAEESLIAYTKRAVASIAKEQNIATHGTESFGLSFECSGAEPCVRMGILLLKARGTFVQLGMGRSDVAIPLELATVRGLTIKGGWRYGAGIYRKAIELIASGRVDVKPLISHRFTFSNAKEAFETASRGTGPDGKAAIKVIIEGPRHG